MRLALTSGELMIQLTFHPGDCEPCWRSPQLHTRVSVLTPLPALWLYAEHPVGLTHKLPCMGDISQTDIRRYQDRLDTPRRRQLDQTQLASA